MERLGVGARAFANALALGLRLCLDIGRGELRGLCRSFGELGGLATRVHKQPLDLLLHPLPLGVRGFRGGQALADPLRAVMERPQDRPPEEPSQQVEEKEELDDRNEHPVRVHRERAAALLDPGSQKHR